MDSANWEGIAALIGIAAIFALLIFVGMQLKQTQEIAVSAAYQSRAGFYDVTLDGVNSLIVLQFSESF